MSTRFSRPDGRSTPIPTTDDRIPPTNKNTYGAQVARSGAISPRQAAEITSLPEHEAELLELARESGLRVKDEARKRRVEGIDPDELHAKQHAAREFVHCLDELGMIRFRGALPPISGVAFVNRLDTETDRLWRAAQREKRTEPRAALAADAFLHMIEGGGTGNASVNIQTVAHHGRRRPAELNTALQLGAPPRFGGIICAEPGCNRTCGLQWDHKDPCANGGLTSFGNMQPFCTPHHCEKTERDRRAGLLAGGKDERGP